MASAYSIGEMGAEALAFCDKTSFSGFGRLLA